MGGFCSFLFAVVLIDLVVVLLFLVLDFVWVLDSDCSFRLGLLLCLCDFCCFLHLVDSLVATLVLWFVV